MTIFMSVFFNMLVS